MLFPDIKAANPASQQKKSKKKKNTPTNNLINMAIVFIMLYF